jgi:hypothetical protein
MKASKIFTLVIFIVGSILVSKTQTVNYQNNDNIGAMIPRYKSNDTIKIADFLKLTEISLTNNEYSIVHFTLAFSYGLADYEESSSSNKITDKMRDVLTKIKLQSDKPLNISIKDITVQSSQNKNVKIGNLTYVLKMK